MADNEKVTGVELTITSVPKAEKVLIGFSNAFFSQAVYLPVTTEEEMDELGAEFHKALVKAAKDVIRERLGLVLPR